jgi:hypothetical protein
VLQGGTYPHCNLNPKVNPTYVLPTPIWSDPYLPSPAKCVRLCVLVFLSIPVSTHTHPHTHQRKHAIIHVYIHKYIHTNQQTHTHAWRYWGRSAARHATWVVCKENTLVRGGVDNALARGVELGMRHVTCMYVCTYRYWGRSGVMHATSGA